MMELPLVVQAVLVFTVLGLGGLATLLTSGAQVRSFLLAWRVGPNAALVRRGFLAASVGMGSVGGSIIALEVGGPGAIGWMWVASILGMALIYSDVLSGLRFRRRDENGRARTATVFALADGVPGIGSWLAYLFAMLFVTFAITAGSMLQTQQSAALLGTLGGDPLVVAGFLVTAAAIGMLVPKLRTFVAALGPVAIVLYVIALIWVLANNPESIGESLGLITSSMETGAGSNLVGGATGLAVALQVGVLRATMATEAGLGSAGFTPEADICKDPEQAASAAMLAPLVSGIVIPTFTALVILSGNSWTGQRIDEAAERVAGADERIADEAEQLELAAALSDGYVSRLSAEDLQRVAPLWAPLERPQSRGTAASLQAGQAIVLPADVMASDSSPDGLVEDHVYPMVMRANPRGTTVKPTEGRNEILLLASDESASITELVYRDRDPKRALQPAYDIRVAVNNEQTGPEYQPLVRLTPVDPEVDIHKLAITRAGPYAVFGDFHFRGRVVQMFQTRWGVHQAMIEADPDPRRPLSLRTTVSSPSFRGPYFDAGEERPPLAMVAREGFDATIGTRLTMEMRAPERGVEIGRLLASGEFQTPPWRFLADTKFALLRHRTDPSKDVMVPVEGKFVDGYLRFLSTRRDIADFADVDRWIKNYSGPYLLPPPYEFEVEVHSGTRFPASTTYLNRLNVERGAFTGPLSERRTLVAVHPYSEPQGSRGELYDPHPAEVSPFMTVPRVAAKGIEQLGWASRSVGPGADLLLAISVLILALTSMIAWSDYGARATEFLFGRGAGIGFRFVFLSAGLAAAGLALGPILLTADGAMVGLVILNGIGTVVLLVRGLRQRAA